MKYEIFRFISVISNLFLIFIQFYERINKLDGKRKRKWEWRFDSERNPSGARKLFPLDDIRHTGHATLTVYSRPVVRAG